MRAGGGGGGHSVSERVTEMLMSQANIAKNEGLPLCYKCPLGAVKLVHGNILHKIQIIFIQSCAENP